MTPQATLVVRTQNNRIRAYPVSNVDGVYFEESRQLGQSLFHGDELVSWQGSDVIVDLRLVDEHGQERSVTHDPVADTLLIQ